MKIKMGDSYTFIIVRFLFASEKMIVLVVYCTFPPPPTPPPTSFSLVNSWEFIVTKGSNFVQVILNVF